MWTKIDKILTDIKDYHLPIVIGVFVTGTVLTWYSRLNHDYVAFAGLVLGAITGHAFKNSCDGKD